MSVVIRPIEPEDVVGLHAVLSCERVMHFTTHLPSTSVAGLRKRLAEEEAAGVMRFVAVADVRVVGSAVLRPRKNPRLAHTGDVGMTVHDDFAGRGIGGALMHKLVELADHYLSLRRLELTVTVDNERAIALYEKHGFVKEGRLRGHKLRDGGLVDAFVMGRLRT